MKCPKCGFENKDDALYCGLCYEVLKREEQKSEINESSAVINKPPQTKSAGLKNNPFGIFILAFVLLVFMFFLTRIVIEKVYQEPANPVTNTVSGVNFVSSDVQQSTRVLFIGNSFTYFNGGIDKQFNHLTSSTQSLCIALGGYTLEKHWNEKTAIQNIRNGGLAYVVLQEQSQTPINDPEKFREYVREFDQEIRHSGAKTILFMTWERPDSVTNGVTTANLAAAFNKVGTEFGIKVAPVGLAFASALRERPKLILCNQDGHPTMCGTYLAACVLYGTIFEHSPVGIAYADNSISQEQRDFLNELQRRVSATNSSAKYSGDYDTLISQDFNEFDQRYLAWLD